MLRANGRKPKPQRHKITFQRICFTCVRCGQTARDKKTTDLRCDACGQQIVLADDFGCGAWTAEDFNSIDLLRVSVPRSKTPKSNRNLLGVKGAKRGVKTT